MTKNVTLRRPKLLDLDQLLFWENNLDSSLFSENPIFYTTEQIEEFLIVNVKDAVTINKRNRLLLITCFALVV